MGLIDGKSALTAIQEFNEKVKYHQEVPRQIAQALQQGTLRNKHFDTVDAYLTDMSQAAKTKVLEKYSYNPESKLADRGINFSMCYMGISTDEDKQPLPDHFIPIFNKLIMRPNLFSLSIRAMPMIWSSEHVEHRFIQRTARAMEYDNDDFKWTMSLGLATAQVMTRKLMQDDKKAAPIVLPSQDGLYLGYAVGCANTSFYPDNFILAGSKDKYDKPFLHGIENGRTVKVQPVWSPCSYLNIRTFISKSEFYPDQQELFEEIQSIAPYNNHTSSPLRTLVNSYEDCLVPSHADERQMGSLLTKLSNVIRSPIWDEVNNQAQKNIPKRLLK